MEWDTIFTKLSIKIISQFDNNMACHESSHSFWILKVAYGVFHVIFRLRPPEIQAEFDPPLQGQKFEDI